MLRYEVQAAGKEPAGRQVSNSQVNGERHTASLRDKAKRRELAAVQSAHAALVTVSISV